VRIFAVVVNWNGGAETLRCLRSLEEQGAALERILVVDNASTDGSRNEIARLHPRVELIDSGANLGYGGGNNLGFARALERGAEAVLVVNNDVTFDRGAVERLAQPFGDAALGCAGPRVVLRDDPRRVWAAGGLLTWKQNLSTLRGFGQADGAEFEREVDVDYVPGCALLVRREVLERIRGFDERYFAYTEDVDFGLRARRAGFRSACIGSARAYHAPSSSTGGGYNPRRKYMMAVNSIWFLREYAGLREWLMFALYDVASLPFALVDGLCRGQAKAVLAKALGLWHGLRGRRVTADVVRSGATRLW
jgi:GT2 family glycosyltransferase